MVYALLHYINKYNRFMDKYTHVQIISQIDVYHRIIWLHSQIIIFNLVHHQILLVAEKC